MHRTIPQNVLTLSPKVDECKPLAQGQEQVHVARHRAHARGAGAAVEGGRGLPLVHFSAQLEPCLTHKNTLHTLHTLNTP